jgi:hypothetical protein
MSFAGGHERFVLPPTPPSRSRSPAIRAIKSNSAGHAYLHTIGWTFTPRDSDT